MTLRIGILALQGAVEPHARKLSELEVTPIPVREESDLSSLSGIILPGGESTTMLRLIAMNRLWQPLKNFVTEKPTWGLCAGVILLAKSVVNPRQESLGVLDICVARNGYGRQRESFIDTITPTSRWPHSTPFESIFIRAPRILESGPLCEVLFFWHNEPVMVKDRNRLGTTFHPELSPSNEMHRYFIEMCQHG